MPKGGARSRSGPAPDPNALRRDHDAGDYTLLPVEGRTGPTPAWPLLDDEPSPRELTVWAQFWRKPQAIIWERDQIFEPVAMFVRQFIEGTDRRASAENRKTVRMMFADLYLTSDSMARAKLRITADEVAEKRVTPPPSRRTSARDRLRAINGEGG